MDSVTKPIETHDEAYLAFKPLEEEQSHVTGSVINPLGTPSESDLLSTIDSVVKPAEMNDDTDLGANPIESHGTTMCKVMVSLYAATMIAAVTLTAASMLTDQFRGRREEYMDEQGCLSMWKYSPDCKGKAMNIQEYFYMCTDRSERFHKASLYTSLCLGFMAAALLGGLVQLCFFRSYALWFCLLCNVLCAVFEALAMALMVDAYSNISGFPGMYTDRCRRLGEQYKYGPGFTLAAVGLGLNIIAVFFLFGYRS